MSRKDEGLGQGSGKGARSSPPRVRAPVCAVTRPGGTYLVQPQAAEGGLLGQKVAQGGGAANVGRVGGVALHVPGVDTGALARPPPPSGPPAPSHPLASSSNSPARQTLRSLPQPGQHSEATSSAHPLARVLTPCTQQQGQEPGGPRRGSGGRNGRSGQWATALLSGPRLSVPTPARGRAEDRRTAGRTAGWQLQLGQRPGLDRTHPGPRFWSVASADGTEKPPEGRLWCLGVGSPGALQGPPGAAWEPGFGAQSGVQHSSGGRPSGTRSADHRLAAALTPDGHTGSPGHLRCRLFLALRPHSHCPTGTLTPPPTAPRPPRASSRPPTGHSAGRRAAGRSCRPAP